MTNMDAFAALRAGAQAQKLKKSEKESKSIEIVGDEAEVGNEKMDDDVDMDDFGVALEGMNDEERKKLREKNQPWVEK
jgi:hypothetical protein